ncbi:MAG: hypothetical protein PHU49_08670 [Syntrophorhabdaceae bacterium]|nr:hypothetical protein [Syntrophorhabdaceae bacterium]
MTNLRKAILYWQLVCTAQFALFSFLFDIWEVNPMAKLYLWLAWAFFTMTHALVYVLFYAVIRGQDAKKDCIL